MSSEATRLAGWAEQHQAGLYLAALILGGVGGAAFPSRAAGLATAVPPLLVLLLAATCVAVPLTTLARAARDVRFATMIIATNFILVPGIVWLLTRSIVDNQALLVGSSLVLLAPCVDYVIVFTGLAGGSVSRLLAATPILMLLQIVLVPVYLVPLTGIELSDSLVGGLAEAGLLYIALPLLFAAILQLGARRFRGPAVVIRAADTGMVPLTILTLGVIASSQVGSLGARWIEALPAIPLFVAFIVIIVPLLSFATRWSGIDVPGRRAVVLSGMTRNSLVVLPLALALPKQLDLAPIVVVGQTLVEIVAMTVCIRLVPRLIPAAAPHGY